MKFNILYQPQKGRINEISVNKGEDIDGDIYRPIHSILDLSENEYKRWIKKNQSKCLVIRVARGKSVIFAWAKSEDANIFFDQWLQQLIDGTAQSGPSILVK